MADQEKAKQKAGGQKKQGSTWEWIFAFAGIRKKDYIVSVFLAVCNVICGLAPYLFLAEIITDLYRGQRDFAGYAQKLLWMLLFWCTAAVFHGLSTAASHRATFYVLGSMRKRACDRLAAMPLGDVLALSSGGLKNTLVERIDSIETTLAHILPEFTSNLLSPVLIFILLLFCDWRIALISLVTVPVGAFCMMGMTKDYDRNNQRCIDMTKTLNDTAVEYIGGIEVIKVFGRTQSSYGKFVTAARNAADAYVSWMRRCTGYFSMAMSVMPATLLGVLPLGGILVRQEKLSPETFIICIVLSLGLIQPVITVMSYTDDLAALRTVLGEITGILEAPEQNRPARSKREPDGNEIVFQDVHFGYGHEDGPEVLHGISLTVREGEVTALVGPSGSGKSTMAGLIAGLWDVKQGQVTLGGVDIRELSAEDFRSRIACVSQNTWLFHDTIRENIRLGRPGASDAEVEAAARAAGCDGFIRKLEHGYDTDAGYGGSHLSGGEKQRISIARAILKNVPVVILDEATAYMDPENEALVEQSITRLVHGKTLLVIAHRLSTIRNADHIAVVSHGEIREEGTHEELLQKGGLYASMWQAHMAVKDR